MNTFGWLIIHGIGTIAYAASGAFVALQARYRMIGVYVLGLTTAFGGGVIRNIIIGIPVIKLWDRETLLLVLGALTILYLLSTKWIHHWKRWGLFFDSIGLASFALQGALYAKQVSDNIFVIIIAALFSGVGGGMIRDLLAGRKPIALQEEVHAVLTILVGLAVWIDGISYKRPLPLILLIIVVVTIRMIAVRFKHLRQRELTSGSQR
ncbi:trimeric intracellular cation channel family protein [Alicyclobacillus sendaiensis]|uniref:trimeric intracellular cation channel family protein n=1 Tax=Alicyclobacillus sendaiensis TaxID=192387 RepID=UPI0007815416|nr:TRIC cation channel family protein [Alicyclobacillus sendaiensis]